MKLGCPVLSSGSKSRLCVPQPRSKIPADVVASMQEHDSEDLAGWLVAELGHCVMFLAEYTVAWLSTLAV